VLRNHLIERFEDADAAADAPKRRRCLTVVVIGGGLVGVELVGEFTAFADDVLRLYPRIGRDEVRCRLFEAGPRIMPEVDARWRPRRRACSSGAGLPSGSRRLSSRSRPGACG
jgi:NADH dehydrogenase